MIEERIGDYRIERVEARGEWDECDAVHLVLPRRVTLRVTLADYPQAGVRLLREACILEALGHPGAPRVYDCGRLGDRRIWIATETLQGTPLLDEVPLAPVRVAALVRDIAGILAHAHARGVIHGGVRMGAIRVVDALRGSRLCLTDWTRARARDGAAPAPSGQSYDAPELAHGEGDERADVFALGVVALEALTGSVLGELTPPALAASAAMRALRHRATLTSPAGQLAALMHAMLGERPARPSARDAGLAAVAIADAMEREVADGAEMSAALQGIEEIHVEELQELHEHELQELELEDLVPPPTLPSVTARTGGTAVARLRRARWTPQMGTEPRTEPEARVTEEMDVEPTHPRQR